MEFGSSFRQVKPLSLIQESTVTLLDYLFTLRKAKWIFMSKRDKSLTLFAIVIMIIIMFIISIMITVMVLLLLLYKASYFFPSFFYDKLFFFVHSNDFKYIRFCLTSTSPSVARALLFLSVSLSSVTRCSLSPSPSPSPERHRGLKSVNR